MKYLSTRPLAAIFMLSLISACSILPESEPVQLLDPEIPAADPAAHTASWSLNVARPESDPMRDSTRVLVRTGQGRLQVHASARWAAAAPELLRMLLVRHLRDARHLEQVAPGSTGLDRTLALDLRRFELSDTGSGRLAAEIRLEARLYDNESGKLLARRVFENREPISDAGADEIVAGFEATLSDIVPALSAWVIERGEASRSAVEG